MAEATARYHINLFRSAEDGCRVADMPDLRFCSAFGDSPEAAVRGVQVAVQACLASAREHGDPIPVPRYRPGHLRGASGGVMGKGYERRAPLTCLAGVKTVSWTRISLSLLKLPRDSGVFGALDLLLRTRLRRQRRERRHSISPLRTLTQSMMSQTHHSVNQQSVVRTQAS
jgi:predicted RNase H-like HicB family nuclease